MKPAPFQLLRPETLVDALRMVRDHSDDVRLLAGGQSLVPLMNFRLATASVIVDLNRIGELFGILREGNRLRIGAMTRQQDILESPLISECAPLLSQAAHYVGHVQTRSRGTIGGSIAQADPSAELPLALTALDATLTIKGARGTRQVPIRSFFQHAMVTDLAPDEILTEISVPVAHSAERCALREYSRRHGDFAIIAAALIVGPSRTAVALGGIAPTPYLCPHVTQHLSARNFNTESFDRAITADLAATEANSDLQASAEFRRHLARVLLHDCMTELAAS